MDFTFGLVVRTCTIIIIFMKWNVKGIF